MASATTKQAGNLEPDFVRQIVAEHRDVQAVFKQFDQAASNKDVMAQEKLAHFTSIALVLHTHVEKELLYPLVEKHVPKGKEIASKALEEHQAVENDLADLEKLKPGSEDFIRTFKNIQKEVETHIKEEEEDMLPYILGKVPHEEALEISKKAVHIKQTASIHPIKK